MFDNLSFNVKSWLKMLLFCLILGLGVFIVLKISFYLVPFIIAFAVSTLMDPLVRFLTVKAKMPRKISSAVSLLLVLGVFGLLIVLLVSKLFSEMVAISKNLPLYYNMFYTNINELIDRASEIYNGLPEQVTKNVGNIISNLSGAAVKFIESLIKGALNTAVSIPEALVFTIVTILATYFLSSDRNKIYGFFQNQFPESWLKRAITIKDDMFSALFGYIRAQLILMSITFTELSIGFAIIGVDYFILLAFGIAVIDALPILGTGGILVPWSIYELLLGNYRMALSLVVLYAIILIVRQLIEPKILGQQIGMYPLVTLMAMYTGLQLFGFIGLIIGPVTTLLLKNILTGVFKNKTFKDYIK